MANNTEAKVAGSLVVRGKKRHYHLRHYVNGKQVIQKLLSETGEPITTKGEAIDAQKLIRAPLGLDKREDQLEMVQARLQGLKRNRKVDKPSLPLSDVWGEYDTSRNRPRSGKSTLLRYRTAIEHFTKWANEAYPKVKTMRDVSQSVANGYANHMEARRLSPASFNIYLQCLTTIWVVLRDKSGTANNPWGWDQKTHTGIQRANVKEEQDARKRRALTLDEINAVIDAAEGDYRILMIILATTGQRLIDAVHLQWADINLNGGVISLIPEKTKRTGKRVHIPILPLLRQTLGSMMQDGRYVLPELVSLYGRIRADLTAEIRNIFDKAGLEAMKETDLKTCKPIRATGAHSFRHSYVTLARAHGVPDRIIRGVTGHASVEMMDGYDAMGASDVSALAIGLPEAPEELRDPVPGWAKERLKQADASNWEAVITEVLEAQK